MKNKYFGLLASAVLAFGATSCVDLDLAPLDQKSTATFWTTYTDAQQAVNELYRWLPSSMWENDEDIYTDNAVHGIKWAVGNLGHGVWNTTDFHWQSEYTVIRRCNLIFQNMDKITDFPSDAERNNVLGQAHFFRAFTYFNLIKQFGDVPYVTEPLELSEQDGVRREDWKSVYAKVMEEFDLAASLLPANPGTNGRISKGAAYAIKARAALYFANPECPHYIEDGYKTAAAAAKACMDLGIYGLYDGGYNGTAKDYTGKYAEMFWDLNMANSNEGILVTNDVASLNAGSYFIGFECFPQLGWGGLNPTEDYVRSFETANGGIVDPATGKSNDPEYNPLVPNVGRDPRLCVNVIFPGDVMYDTEVLTQPLPSSGVRALWGRANACGDATLTGYQAKKWLNPAVDPGSTGWDHNASSAVVRYTEVLLIYAEAQCALKEEKLALETINKVRARVGMPALQNTDASALTYCKPGTNDLRDRIRQEWRAEFSFEGNHRQWDVRRWNIAETCLDTDKKPRTSYLYKIVEDAANAKEGDDGRICPLYGAVDGSTWDIITNQVLSYGAHNYVYPIPQDDIELLGEERLPQNPGY